MLSRMETLSFVVADQGGVPFVLLFIVGAEYHSLGLIELSCILLLDYWAGGKVA